MAFADTISVVALAVSLVALLIASVQMTQQLLSTAYDGYRRCSAKTIGGWGGRTHRRFVWRELRFEVTFSTPLIELVLDSPPPLRGRIRTDQSRYCLLGRGDHKQWFNATPRPWFLQSEKAVPEAKCSWLVLLEDTALVNVQVNITQRLGSWDYVPTTLTRPMASIDRKSFLTLMSLFGINWKNKGKDGEFIGAGRFCEIRFTKIVDVGEVLHYEESRHRGDDDPNNQRFFLESEKARLAMFHCFDLGFATFRTQNVSELVDSLKHSDALQKEEGTVDTISGFYIGSTEWCPGLSESITCWAEASMPKSVNLGKDTFKSQFSAVSARSLTTGTPKFVAMLLGGECDEYCFRAEKVDSVDTLTGWAWQYLASFPDVKGKVFGCLKLAASEKTNNNIVDLTVSWTQSKRCLEGVRALDEHLETHLIGNFDYEQRKKLKSYFSNRQIIRGSTLFPDSNREAGIHNTFWLDELDRVGASNYVRIAQDIEEKVGNPVLAQTIVVNRLMRGSLWVVHNSNAPDQYKRVLECSLSSSWLQEDNPTLKIA